MTVYLKVVDSELVSAPNKSVIKLLAEGYSAFDEGDYAQYLVGAKTFDFDSSEFLDEPSEEYTANELAKQKASLQAQIDELDMKRIRAGFEPSVKDEETGQTWLEYYTEQIEELREDLSSLD